jgi:hypothetical protein
MSLIGRFDKLDEVQKNELLHVAMSNSNQQLIKEEHKQLVQMCADCDPFDPDFKLRYVKYQSRMIGLKEQLNYLHHIRNYFTDLFDTDEGDSNATQSILTTVETARS